MGNIVPQDKWVCSEDSGFNDKQAGRAKDRRKRELKKARKEAGEQRQRRKMKEYGGWWE